MPSNAPSHWHGMEVVLSPFLTECSEPFKVRRSWRERLFTRPWQPWVATRWMTQQIPSKQAYQMASGQIVIHPETFRQLRASMQEIP